MTYDLPVDCGGETPNNLLLTVSVVTNSLRRRFTDDSIFDLLADSVHPADRTGWLFHERGRSLWTVAGADAAPAPAAAATVATPATAAIPPTGKTAVPTAGPRTYTVAKPVISRDSRRRGSPPLPPPRTTCRRRPFLPARGGALCRGAHGTSASTRRITTNSDYP